MFRLLLWQNNELDAVEEVVGGHGSGDSFANGETIIVFQVETNAEMAKGDILSSEIENVVCCIGDSSVHRDCILQGGITAVGHEGINANLESREHVAEVDRPLGKEAGSDSIGGVETVKDVEQQIIR
ncbi:Os02g0824800 [Oryza sativa Japonica Group]|uniref:Os02g0824800 protein n=1 Tax=Oryza sativa subsp. japonica TaxID=39947 RepID=A0A0P0VRL5_ORYSJ|nr:Os02g0824800 [Oryza sativa Japonica Group]